MNRLLLAVLVVSLVIGGVLVTRWMARRDVGGFRDWVKNPALKKQFAEEFAAREKMTEIPPDLPDREIESMVNRLFGPEIDELNVERLKHVGARAVPFLVAALDRPDARVKQAAGKDGLPPKTTIKALCDVLEPLGPPEAIEPLTRILDLPDDKARKAAAMVLGSTGKREAIAPVVRALGDPDDYVRSYAMTGIQRAMQGGRASRDFLEGVFPALEPLLSRKDLSVSGHAPELMLAIDASRALPIMLSDRYFNIGNSQLQELIKSLNQAGHRIPQDRLTALMRQLKPLVQTYPHSYEFGETLIAYAHNPDKEAESAIRNELRSENEIVRQHASEALLIVSGIDDPSVTVFDAADEKGYDALNEAQKFYLTATIYDGEVRNGGHAQYFVNSSGDLWKTALEALETIGATQRAGILREATRLFGAEGPSPDNEARHMQLADFSKEQDGSLDQLDKRYYACTEDLHVLLSLYAIDHRTSFRARESK